MDKIDKILSRGVANIIPSKEDLEKVLNSDKKLNVYLGIDPTATRIHLGHAVSLIKLQKFAELGHNVTFLIGDFTAFVGDTSDKDSERPLLSKEEIEKNFQTYKGQASKIVNFDEITIKYNSEWLKDLDFSDLIQIAQLFSVGDFVNRELIRDRLKSGKRVGLQEFFYPLMQGYDSYQLKTDVQIGGADQTFNMQAGRTLIKALDKRESYVLSTDYLMGTDGRKMSKSWGNAIWLDDSSEDIYSKVLQINDELIIQYFTLVTRISSEEIENIQARLDKGENPINIKKELAFEIVKDLDGEENAKKAQDEFERVVQKGELPKGIDSVHIKADRLIDADLLVELGLASSKSDAKRLFEQDAVALDGQKIKSGQQLAEASEGLLLSVGKKMIKLTADNG